MVAIDAKLPKVSVWQVCTNALAISIALYAKEFHFTGEGIGSGMLAYLLKDCVVRFVKKVFGRQGFR
jgi:hypothetical protein